MRSYITPTGRWSPFIPSRLCNWLEWLGLGDGQPLLLLCQSNLDVADRLEILAQLVGVIMAQATLQIPGVLEHGVKDVSADPRDPPDAFPAASTRRRRVW